MSFVNITSPKWDAALGLVAACAKVSGRKDFKRLSLLRNCGLHRRVVYIRRLEIKTDSAYQPVETSTLVAPRVYRWEVCKDPNLLKPEKGEMVELLNDLASVRRRSKQDLLDLAKVL